MEVFYTNSGQRITDADLMILAACHQEECDEHFSAIWALNPDSVKIRFCRIQDLPVGAVHIDVGDQPIIGEDGVLGEHWVEGRLPSGVVYAGYGLDNGEGVFMPPVGAPDGVGSISETLSHELFELLCNPMTDIWWSTAPIIINGTTYSAVAGEVADPVEGTPIVRSFASGNEAMSIQVSDYVTPSWHTPGVGGPYSRSGALTGPLTLAPRSYVVTRDAAGREAPVFDERMPAYKRRLKEAKHRRRQKLQAQGTYGR